MWRLSIKVIEQDHKNKRGFQETTLSQTPGAIMLGERAGKKIFIAGGSGWEQNLHALQPNTVLEFYRQESAEHHILADKRTHETSGESKKERWPLWPSSWIRLSLIDSRFRKY